ncbi:MAG: IS1380 family transposase, partial [Actinomycetota bacterium]|nr:IS1380 family transposase [Actinomycetota bacterium]
RPAPVDRLTVARTVRMRLLVVPGRLVNRAGTLVLRGPLDWPWRQWFNRRLDVLRSLQPSTG